MAAAGPAAAFVAAGYALFSLMGLWDAEPYVPDVATAISGARHGYLWNKANQKFERSEDAVGVANVLADLWARNIYRDLNENREMTRYVGDRPPGVLHVDANTNQLYQDVYGDKPIYVHAVPEGDEALYEPHFGTGIHKTIAESLNTTPSLYQLKTPNLDQIREAMFKRAEGSSLPFDFSGGNAADWWTHPPEGPDRDPMPETDEAT